MAKRAEEATRQDTGNTKDRILDTAIELFARSGVEGVSLALLADQVGLHKSSLFHYFRGKGELADAALRRATGPINEILESLDRERPDLEQFIEVGLRLDDHLASQPATARFLLRAIVGTTPELEAHLEQREDFGHPVLRLFIALGLWLEHARAANVIRPVRVRHAVVNLLGTALLYPAIADDMGSYLFSQHIRDPASRKARRDDLESHLRAVFEPR